MKTIQSYLFYGCKEFSTLEYNADCKPTAIEKYAFAGGCKGLTSIDIPATVTTIGVGAFKDCEKLENIVIKPAVTSIGNYAFNGCTSMTSVVFEESEETLKLGYGSAGSNSSLQGKGLFIDCPLQSVFIGRPLSYNTNLQYGYSPFSEVETLTKAHFGNPVKTIQPYLFRYCKSLKTLQYNSNCLPSSIDDYAFWGCTSLTETDIFYPESVKTIGKGAFRYCISLEGYTIPNHISTVGSNAFENCEKLASVVVKPSVTSIGNGAFNGCTSLTGVVFEESEETLKLGYGSAGSNSSLQGKGLFIDCPLQSVFIGRPLSYSTDLQYGYSPFAYNTTITEAHFGNPVKAIQLYLFYGCKEFSTLEYNADCKPTAIENYAFAGGCKGLTSIDIPATVTTIGAGAFKDCEKLENIVIKPAVTSIGNYAFNGCTAMTQVVIDDGEGTLSLGYGSDSGNSNTLGKGLFSDSPLNAVYIGRNINYNPLQRYGDSPFTNISSIKFFTFGDNVTIINAQLLRGCSSIEKLTIPNKVTDIGKSAFINCSGLTEIKLSNNLKTIDSYVFYGCSQLNELILPSTLTSIGDYAFYGCAKFTEMEIPSAVSSIGNYAFSGCTGITNIKIEDGEEVLSLGYGASSGEAYGLFKDCPLEELYLGRTLDYKIKSDGSYGYSPFYKKETLSKITVGTKVSSLPYCIFFGSAIEELYVPSSVRTVHSSFANGCANLKKVIILGSTPPTVDTYNTIFSGSAEGCKLHVFFPDKYLATKTWKDYANMIEPICTFDHSGNKLVYQTDFPITLSNLDLDKTPGQHTKKITVAYTTNGYDLEDILEYEYTVDLLLGDVNSDNLVNVTDIVATVNYIMEKNPANFNKAAADLNGDGEINVTDIVKMVSIIMASEARKME